MDKRAQKTAILVRLPNDLLAAFRSVLTARKAKMAPTVEGLIRNWMLGPPAPPLPQPLSVEEKESIQHLLVIMRKGYEEDRSAAHRVLEALYERAIRRP